MASPFFIGAKTFLAHESDARSDEICRAIEFEDTFVKLRPSDGAQVFFFRGGLDGPSGMAFDGTSDANHEAKDPGDRWNTSLRSCHAKESPPGVAVGALTNEVGSFVLV